MKYFFVYISKVKFSTRLFEDSADSIYTLVASIHHATSNPQTFSPQNPIVPLIHIIM